MSFYNLPPEGEENHSFRNFMFVLEHEYKGKKLLNTASVVTTLYIRLYTFNNE
jgi:hypothetical protein